MSKTRRKTPLQNIYFRWLWKAKATIKSVSEWNAIEHMSCLSLNGWTQHTHTWHHEERKLSKKNELVKLPVSSFTQRQWNSLTFSLTPQHEALLHVDLVIEACLGAAVRRVWPRDLRLANHPQVNGCNEIKCTSIMRWKKCKTRSLLNVQCNGTFV